MSVEVFANNGSTTLSAAITTVGATTCAVTSASSFPSTGNFRIAIDSEILIVTGVSGTTFTVTRGAEGTTAATHLINAPVTHVLTAAVMQALQRTLAAVQANTSSVVYTCDSSGPAFDALILHNKSGKVTYVMPAPTVGRVLEIRDITGAIETGGTGGYAGGNWIFCAPNGAEKFNASSGYSLSGSNFHFTNGSATVTATSSKFTTELAPGMSIQPSSQAGVSYIVSSIATDTSLTLTANYLGSTSTTATAKMNSLAYYANFGLLTLYSDGTDWFASSNKPLRAVFTASGTFIPSPGCTSADLDGFGGGGGGGSGASNNTLSTGGGGGGGALAGSVSVTQTPNTSIAVAIGAAGGSGGAVTISTGANGGIGGDTSYGSLAAFRGASGGAGGASSANTDSGGGAPVGTKTNNIYGITNDKTSILPTGTNGLLQAPAGGGFSDANASNALAGLDGANNITGTGSPGTGGTASAGTTGGGGGGGGQGPEGNGGNGGNGVASGTANAGGSPAANTGAGGGGGGGQFAGGSASGAGGTGGSGKLYVSLPM